MSIKSLEQRRAAHASEVVNRMIASHTKSDPSGTLIPDDEAKKFAIHAKKLPSRIIGAGLGQALAFLVGKKYCPSLLEGLGQWIVQERQLLGAKAETIQPDTLLKTILAQNSDFLRAATAEALVYLQWLNRFVDANKLEGDES